MDDGKPIVGPTELQAQANLLSVLQLVGAALTTLAADVTGRVAKIRDRGVVRLIECADAPLAKLIANDPRTQMSREAGWPVDWSGLDPERNTEASIASLRGDNGLLRDLLGSLVGR
jgi:hypothetical protein